MSSAQDLGGDRPASARDGSPPGARRTGLIRRLLAADHLAFAAVQSVLLQVLTVLANMVTGILTARLLGAEGRGLYAAATTLPSLLGMVAVAGTADGVLLRVRRRPEQTRATAGWGLLVAVAASTGFALGGYFLLPRLLGAGHEAAIDVARLALVFIHVTALGAIIRQVFAGQGRFLFANLGAFLPHLFHALTMSGFALAGDLTVETAVFSLVVGAVAAQALLTPFLWRQLTGSFGRLRDAGVEVCDFARRAVVADLLALCSGWADRLVLIVLLSPQALGLYVVAYGFSRIVTIATPATGILLSGMSHKAADDAKALHDVALRCSVTSLAALVAAVYLVDDHLIGWLYGRAFSDATGIFEILVLQSAANRISQVTAQLFLASNRPGYVSFVRLADVAASLSLIILLTPVLGAHGAALGLLAGGSLRLLLLWAGIVVLLRLRFPRLWLSFEDVRAARRLLQS